MQIFFDATTRRQIPFSAVIISLMGDEPGSFDPIIVSLCVIMRDETSELMPNQMDISDVSLIRIRIAYIPRGCSTSFVQRYGSVCYSMPYR